jgi:hypothetical protein
MVPGKIARPDANGTTVSPRQQQAKPVQADTYAWYRRLGIAMFVNAFIGNLLAFAKVWKWTKKQSAAVKVKGLVVWVLERMHARLASQAEQEIVKRLGTKSERNKEIDV